MFSFETTDVQRFAISLIGALILSAACVVSAVGPAQAASAPTSLADSSQAASQAAPICPHMLPIRL